MNPFSFQISDLSIPLTGGAGKFIYTMPGAYTPARVFATLLVPQTSGPSISIDLKCNGVSVLASPIMLDNSKRVSLYSASPGALLTGTILPFLGVLSVDVLGIGDGTAKGLMLHLVDDLETVPPEIVPPPPIEALIDRTLGTIIGNMTVFGIGNAFNGVTSAAGASCAAISAAPGWVGKTYSAGKKFSRAIVYGPNDRGFIDPGPPLSHGVSVTINIRGKNGTPSGRTDGAIIGSITFSDVVNQSAGKQIVSTDTINAYTNIWADILGSPQDSTYCAELVLYERV